MTVDPHVVEAVIEGPSSMAHPKTNIINEKKATSTIIGVVPAPVTRNKHLRPTGPPHRPHPERIIREDQVGSVKFPCKYYHSHVGCFTDHCADISMIKIHGHSMSAPVQ